MICAEAQIAISVTPLKLRNRLARIETTGNFSDVHQADRLVAVHEKANEKEGDFESGNVLQEARKDCEDSADEQRPQQNCLSAVGVRQIWKDQAGKARA